MTKTGYALGLAAIGTLVAQPCIAATQSAETDERRMAAFAGLNVRIALGASKPARPAARLQLTSSYHVRDARTGSRQTLKAKGLEIGVARNGTPALYMNGQNAAEIKNKAGLSSSTPDTVWIIFGVALVAVGVLVISNLDGLSD
jgi:hypothetical protein